MFSPEIKSEFDAASPQHENYCSMQISTLPASWHGAETTGLQSAGKKNSSQSAWCYFSHTEWGINFQVSDPLNLCDNN